MRSRFYTPDPEDRFGAKLRITASLEGSRVVTPNNVIEGWLAKHVQELEHQVEGLAPVDFVSKAEAFFVSTGMDKVVAAWAGGEQVLSPTKDEKEAPGVQDALRSLAAEVQGGKHVDEVKIEAGGRNLYFEMHQIIAYRHVHDVKGPALYFDVLALPLEWSRKNGEDEVEYVQRVNKALDDKSRVDEMDAWAKGKLESMAQDYESVLKRGFYATDLTSDIKVDFAKTVVQ